MSELDRLKKENAKLKQGIRLAIAALYSWIYSVKSRRIHDIYDDLKDLVKNDG